MKKTRSVSENHAKAPLCAEFVKAMRDVFGPDQVKVLWVKEGDVEEGRQERFNLELVEP